MFEIAKNFNRLLHLMLGSWVSSLVRYFSFRTIVFKKMKTPI